MRVAISGHALRLSTSKCYCTNCLSFLCCDVVLQRTSFPVSYPLSPPLSFFTSLFSSSHALRLSTTPPSTHPHTHWFIPQQFFDYGVLYFATSLCFGFFFHSFIRSFVLSLKKPTSFSSLTPLRSFFLFVDSLNMQRAAQCLPPSDSVSVHSLCWMGEGGEPKDRL